MADAREIPQLTNELIELSKQYLRQETLEPAKRLGRVVGLSLVAALCFAFGAVLLIVGSMRLLVEQLPDSQLWSALGVVVTAISALIVAVMIMYYAVRVEPDDR